jgi:hypothetical protein
LTVTLPRHPPHTPEEFLPFLWNGYERQSGHLHAAIRLHDEKHDWAARWTPAGRFSRIVSDVARIGTHHDVYAALGIYSRKRRERTSVMGLRWLWADLDAHELAATVPPATLAMETSPGRTQALWALRAPADATEAEERVRAIAAACGLGNGAVAANQVIRIPGTVNLGARKGRPDARVQVVEYRARRVYGLDDFAHLAGGPAPHAAGKRVKLIPPGERDAVWARIYPLLTGRTQRLADGYDEPDRHGEPYPTPSEGDYGLIVALVRVGLTASEAGGVFLATRRGRDCIWRHGLVEAATRAEKHAANAAATVAETGAAIAIPAAAYALPPKTRPNALAVYASVAAYAVDSGRCWAANERVAEELGLADPETVGRARRVLRDAGLLVPDEPVGRAHCDRIATTEGVQLPVATMRAAREKEGALGVAILAILAAGEHDTQAAIATALGIGRKRAGRCLCSMEGAEIVREGERGAGGLRHYCLAEET